MTTTATIRMWLPTWDMMFLNSFHALTKSCMKCGPDDDACSICNHCIILIFLFIDQKKFRNMETNKIYKTEYSKIAENQKSIKPLKNKTKKKWINNPRKSEIQKPPKTEENKNNVFSSQRTQCCHSSSRRSVFS